MTQLYRKKNINTIVATSSLSKIGIDESTLLYEQLPKVVKNLHREVADSLISLLYYVSADLIKLKLWLYDFTNKVEYVLFCANFIFLSIEEQQKFIKKSFYLMLNGDQNISYDKLISLKNMTFNFTEGKKYQLDFSCNVVLACIDDLKRGRFLAEKEIFDLISKYVEQDTSALLSLGGFFDKCSGRALPDEVEQENDEERIVTLKFIPAPHNVEFCEGVKYGGDGKDKKYKHDCWWCRSRSCYRANQSDTFPDDYNEFTLLHFFNILGVKIDKKAYFDFMGLMNRISVFLKHLNCRSCNHILQPAEENYYGYYRVSNFECTNKQCSKYKKNIYLSHCLGAKKGLLQSRCYNLIDSRDTKRCNYIKHSPRNEYEKYGPYICNFCGSCCSQKSLEKKQLELSERKWSIPKWLSWKVKNKVGHLERGEVFCHKCGAEMIDATSEHNEFMTLLENNSSNTTMTDFKILKKGTNKYGTWYLVEAKDKSFFEKAILAGFRVSNTQRGEANVKFISDTKVQSEYLVCKSCRVTYNNTKAEFIYQRLQEVDYQITHP